MKIVLINGSPKVKGSTSEALIGALKDRLSSKADVIEIGFHSPTLPQGVIDQMHDADAWVFLYPLYVDGIPGHLLSCLVQLEQNRGRVPERRLITHWRILQKRYSGERQMKNVMQISGFRGLYISLVLSWAGTWILKQMAARPKTLAGSFPADFKVII